MAVKSVFLETASSLELDLNEIPDHVPLSQLAVQGQAYLHVETPDRATLFGRIQRNFPLQFGREVMADERLLDMAERVGIFISLYKAVNISTSRYLFIPISTCVGGLEGLLRVPRRGGGHDEGCEKHVQSIRLHHG